MHRIPNTNIVFAHIPKTGGQAIKAALGIANESSAHEVGVPSDKEYFKPGFFRFCVVRHPVKRFISAYRYNVKHSSIKPTGVREFLIEKNACDDINVFVQALRERKSANWTHFRSQLDFIALAKPQIILRQETLKHDIKIFEPLLGKKIALKRKNVSKKDGDTKLTNENRAFVRAIYADDIRVLGYRPGKPIGKIDWGETQA